jgi:intraflagellar transport protein 81
VTSNLRKEQEEELRIFERIRNYRQGLEEAEMRLSDATRRLKDLKSSGIQSMSSEQLLVKLQKDVKDLNDRREQLDISLAEREMHLEKLQGWDTSDRVTTDDDVRIKREQVHDAEDQLSSLQEKLDAALERNTKLVVFRQASAMALKKLREKEDEIEKLVEDKRRLRKQIEDKENELRAQGKGSGKIGKMELKKYGAMVRDKIEDYKRMREELSAVRAELVVLQRTEQILKSRHKNLDEFLADLEKKKGVEGYRETRDALVEMSEKTAVVDQLKGATLEEISTFVEQIGREFRSKQAQLQPLIQELKGARQEYMDIETEYLERKANYDKIAIGLEMEKNALEKDCDTCQVRRKLATCYG